MNNNKKQVLEKRLSLLIGFDEVSDLVEHCLSLGTSEELSEFLTSLLGVYNDEIKRYCDDIAAFKSGRSLSSDVAISSSSSEKKEGKERKPAARELDYSIGKTSSTTKNNNEFSISSSSSKKRNSRLTTKNNRNSKLENKRNNLKNRRNKGNLMEPAVKNDKKSNKNTPIYHPHPKNDELKNPSTNNNTSTTAIYDVTPTIQQQHHPTQLKKLEEKEESTQKKGPHQQQQQQEEKVEPLERGKAKIECGCFGTICKPLTNCLYCGRIQCEREGYGFCPYCGFRVSPVDYSSTSVLDSNGQKPKDILHKERLLKFDREFTQRTQIYNDDEDYFQNTSSKWLSQEEKVDAQTKDEEDRKGKHQRGAMTLKIDF